MKVGYLDFVKKLMQWIDEEPFINWNPLKRCILMLALGCAINLLWLVWKIYIIFTPAVQHFVNMQIIQFQLVFNIASMAIFLFLIYVCYRLRNSKIMQRFLPFICVIAFCSVLFRNGYLSGIFNPATVITFVSIITVGLVSFERKIVYSNLLIFSCVFGFMVFQTVMGYLPYAPGFNLKEMVHPFTNTFWLYSMLYFFLPIFLMCFTLLELILSQWRAREQQFKRLSQVDPLTETFNKRSINQYLLEIEKQHNNHSTMQFGVVLLDLDNFKSVNDIHGHLKGDEVLMRVADLLKQNVRSYDIVGRFGGEEFILIIKNTTIEYTQLIAERCRQSVLALQVLGHDNLPIPLSASFGVVLFDTQTSLKDTLHLADIAMYQAKEAGRNTIVTIDHNGITPSGVTG